MGKLGFTAIFITMCGLFGALHTSSGAATAIAPPPAALTADTVTADDEAGCEGATTSEDAASCSTGGWTATLTCCGNALERWTRSGQTKCCGACFLP